MNNVLVIAIGIAVLMCCVYFIQLLSPIKEWYDGNLYKTINTIPRGYVEVDDIIGKKDLAKYEKLSYLVLTSLLSFAFMYHILVENPQGNERKIMALLVIVFLATTIKGLRARKIVKAIKKHYGV